MMLSVVHFLEDLLRLTRIDTERITEMATRMVTKMAMDMAMRLPGWLCYR
jgi:hypothetical protein